MLEIQGYKDLYEQERLKVYNMDCMELLKQVPDKYFDLAIVDPPYGIKRNKMTMGNSIFNKDNKEWDFNAPNETFFKELFRISENQIIWGGNYFNLPQAQYFCIWDKGETMYNRDFAECEYSWVSSGGTRIFKYSPNQLTRIHPTQKPVALYTWLLEKYAKPNFKIIDTHFGSGSHGISNHYFGSELIACELDEDYFKASVERIKKETRQLSFLQGGV